MLELLSSSDLNLDLSKFSPNKKTWALITASFCRHQFNSLPNVKIVDQSTLKAVADDIINVKKALTTSNFSFSHGFCPVCLSLLFVYLSTKNFSMHHNFGMVWHRAFILHMCATCGEMFCLALRSRSAINVKVKYQDHIFQVTLQGGIYVYKPHPVSSIFCTLPRRPNIIKNLPKQMFAPAFRLTAFKQAIVFTFLMYKSSENSVGKGEIACNKQFLLFPQRFQPFQRFFHYLY